MQRVLELERTVEKLQQQLDESRRTHERDLADLAARGFNPGGLVPAVARSRAVTLYRATRGPASEIEAVSGAAAQRPRD